MRITYYSNILAFSHAYIKYLPYKHTDSSILSQWYLQRRAFSWHSRSVLVVPLLQTLCLIYAAVCSLTRVTDHRHHWWDVLVGGTMGMLSVLYTVSGNIDLGAPF